MIIHLKKNEATEIFFPMVNVTNPETFDTGETVTDTAYYKDGAGSWTSLAITDTVSEIGTTGMYEISLTASEMNHDYILIKFTSTNAQDTAVLIKTYTRDVDDLAFPTTPGNSIDVTATGAVGIDWGNVENQGTTVDLSATSTNVVDVLTGHTAQTGDSYARLGAPIGASISADIQTVDTVVDNIETDTQDIQTRLPAALVGGRMDSDAVAISGSTAAADSVEANIGNLDAAITTRSSHAAADVWTVGTRALTDKAGFTISGTKTTLDVLNDVSLAGVNAQVDDALSDIGLDHLVSAAVTGTDITDNSIIAKLVSKSATADWDTYNNTTDSLEANIDNAATAADVADAVWDEVASGHTTGGTFGEQCGTDIDAILVDTAVIGAAGAGLTAVPWNTAWASPVNAEVADVLKTDTIAELSGTPGSTPTMEEAIMWLYMKSANKRTSTSSADTVANAADTTIASSTNSDSAGTFTRGKYA